MEIQTFTLSTIQGPSSSKTKLYGSLWCSLVVTLTFRKKNPQIKCLHFRTVLLWQQHADDKAILFSHNTASALKNLRVNHVMTIFSLDHSLSHVVQCNRKFIGRQQGVWLYATLCLSLRCFFKTLWSPLLSVPPGPLNVPLRPTITLSRWRAVGVTVMFVKEVIYQKWNFCQFESEVYFRKTIVLCRQIKYFSKYRTFRFTVWQ